MRLRRVSPSLLLAIILGIFTGRYITLDSSGSRQRKLVKSLYCPDEGELQIFEEALLTCLYNLDEKKEELAAGVAKLKKANEDAEDRDPGQPSWRKAFGKDCLATDAEIKSFFIVDHGSTCPDDSALAHELAFKKNCFLLPRRRCFAKMPQNYVEPLSFPQSLWAFPSDTNIVWGRYRCKSFKCLSEAEEAFNIESANERIRFVSSAKGTGQRHSIPSVLALKPGGIRVGLDIGGGTGTFAAQMAAFNVTILTTGMNSGVPQLEMIALRGLVPLVLPQLQQLPFFNNGLDMIHVSRSVQIMEARDFDVMIYDWHRVLRPGGLLWIEALCSVETVMIPHVTSIKRLNYTEHEWVEEEWSPQKLTMRCVTALLEKPIGAPRSNFR